MLARYQIVRGRRPPENPLPQGVRVDIRKHTRHVLAPDPKSVERYLAAPDDRAWKHFRAAYLALLEQRFAAEPEPFVALAAQAMETDVHLGCNCSTAKNPDVHRCHTVVALEFMHARFPRLEVRMP